MQKILVVSHKMFSSVFSSKAVATLLNNSEKHLPTDVDIFL